MEFRWKIGDTWHSNQDSKPESIQAPKRESKSGDHIDEIIAEYEQKGGFKSLDGHGKPLDLSTNRNQDDLFYKTLKNANVRPPWLELQHQIRERIEKVLTVSRQSDAARLNITSELSAINTLIKQFNALCPAPSLQKPLLQEQQLEQQAAQWI